MPHPLLSAACGRRSDEPKFGARSTAACGSRDGDILRRPRFRHDAGELYGQKPVCHLRPADVHIVRQIKAVLEGARGDTSIKVSLAVRGFPARNEEETRSGGDRDLGRCPAGDRKGQPIGVVTQFFDIVGRIIDVMSALDRPVKHPEEIIKADAGTQDRRQSSYRVHSHILR
jgi:hypothetical protein